MLHSPKFEGFGCPGHHHTVVLRAANTAQTPQRSAAGAGYVATTHLPNSLAASLECPSYSWSGTGAISHFLVAVESAEWNNHSPCIAA